MRSKATVSISPHRVDYVSYISALVRYAPSPLFFAALTGREAAGGPLGPRPRKMRLASYISAAISRTTSSTVTEPATTTKSSSSAWSST